MHTYIHTIHACVRVGVHGGGHIHTYACTYIRMYTHVLYVCMYVCSHIHTIHACVRVGVHGGGGRELDDAAAVRACVCVQRV